MKLTFRAVLAEYVFGSQYFIHHYLHNLSTRLDFSQLSFFLASFSNDPVLRPKFPSFCRSVFSGYQTGVAGYHITLSRRSGTTTLQQRVSPKIPGPAGVCLLSLWTREVLGALTPPECMGKMCFMYCKTSDFLSTYTLTVTNII